ncbi:cryptochrome/photolyase family protein [Mucilaginibacter terrae]|uniref:Deoxyribodipyrimidine photo-lyase n=1 Tax=Mucilaginibacter terrae TaxID=1955052 RepID=A0ABU3GSP4_9SPHI|nr:deoxyribodipyrimidine photo-lyase [Mucilaginibacter terrae]MDT3402795.1 deoxyribodipyrimidine photo-lyase [Mucilaginibacter terrae]
MDKNSPVTVFWFRRDLRLHDNAGLYHALKGPNPVLCLFIFDRVILDKLEDKNDARVTFIYNTIAQLDQELQKHKSSLLVKYNKPEDAWKEVLKEYEVEAVYTNRDYEPYAKRRDGELGDIFHEIGITFKTFKDHVIFEREEVVKDDKKPYTVFTPYKRRWMSTITDFYLKAYPTEKYFKNLLKTQVLTIPSLKSMGFEESSIPIPDTEYKSVIDDYARDRDIPGKKGTSHIGLHLRFGTLSIREVTKEAFKHEHTWLGELIWREFYSMSFDFFPETEHSAYRPAYDRIEWRNNEKEFEAWCEGKTGYPLVDAGMRELNATGFMHNRVRMVTASFLIKHLLIDWRWGEHYFAQKLLDYEASTNIGSWQWVAGSGTDVMPYFRIFNPEAQKEKFDPKMVYIKKWVPEYGTNQYPEPIINNKAGKERALEVYKKAVAK